MPYYEQPQNPPATKTVEKGEVVAIEPKNPLKSTALWGLIVILTTAMVQKYAPPLLQDQVVASVLEVVIYVAGGLMVAMGRWKANRPLGFGNDKQNTVIKGILLALMIFPLGACAPTAPVTGDPVVVYAERNVKDAATVIDAFLDLEYENQAYVKSNLPEVHAVAEQLRREAPNALREARRLTEVYKLTRTADAQNQQNAALDRAYQLAKLARDALAQYSRRR